MAKSDFKPRDLIGVEVMPCDEVLEVVDDDYGLDYGT